MKHKYEWHNTSIGGFAQCLDCHIMDTELTKKDCINYINPEDTKRKRLAEREIQRQATIAWLNKK